MTSQCWQAIAFPCAELHVTQHAGAFSLTKPCAKRVSLKARHAWRINSSRVRGLCARSQLDGHQPGLVASGGQDDLLTWEGANQWTDEALREKVESFASKLGDVVRRIDSFSSGQRLELSDATSTGSGTFKLPLQEVQLSTVGEEVKSKAVAWWKEADPWNKWPVAVFLPGFLLSFVVCNRCAKDLLPFWILGPLLIHLIIKTSMALAKQTAPLRQVAVTRGSALYLAAKSGELKRDAEEGVAYLRSERFISEVKATVGEKQKLLLAGAKEKKEALRTEFHKWTSEKKDELVEYRKSGQMKDNAQVWVKSAVGAGGEWVLARLDQVEGLLEPYMMKVKEFLS